MTFKTNLIQAFKMKSKFLDIYLDTICDDNIHFSTSSECVEITGTITVLLTKSDTRIIGLQLLNKYLGTCPTVDNIEKKINTWISLISKGLNKNAPQECDLIYIILRKLVLKIENISELMKTVGNTHLANIYESVSHAPPSAYFSALQCVEVCLRLFVGQSKTMANSIEKLLNSFVDTTSSEISYVIGKCHLQLLIVRTGGLNINDLKVRWRAYQEKVLQTLHLILDLTFPNCVASKHSYSDDKMIELNSFGSDLNHEPVLRSVQLFIRFRNYINYLVVAIEEPFHVTKEILPKKILDVIIRGFKINSSTLNATPLLSNFTTIALLSKFHIELLKLLSTLILCLGVSLKKYHHIILDLASNILKWTSYNRNTSSYFIRKKTYEVISLWCDIMRHGSNCDEIAKSLVHEIFVDITLNESDLLLCVSDKTHKHLSKKERIQIKRNQNKESYLVQSNKRLSENISIDRCNGDLCVVALNCLKKLLTSSSNLLNPRVMKHIQNKIIDVGSKLYFHPVYYNWQFRLDIFRCLYIITFIPNPLCPPESHLILKVVQSGIMYEQNIEVRNYCRQLLLQFEQLIHPQKEGLLFPVPHRNIQNDLVQLGEEHRGSCITGEEKTNCGPNATQMLCEGYSETFVDTISSNNKVIAMEDDVFNKPELVDCENNGLKDEDSIQLNKDCSESSVSTISNQSKIIAMEDDVPNKPKFDVCATNVLKDEDFIPPPSKKICEGENITLDDVALSLDEKMLAEMTAAFVDELN